MKHGILTAAFLMASAGFASADYVIIVANVGGTKVLSTAGFAGMPGMMGMRGGMGGMTTMPPGMGVAGSRPPGMGMAGGPGQGMQPPGMGIQGGSRGMMMGMGPGMPGGMMMGMRGGMMGMMGFGATDVDENPDYVIAVVEVKSKKNLSKLFDSPLTAQMPAPVGLPERLGKSCQLLKEPPFGKMYVITEAKGKPLPAVSVRFEEKFNLAVKEKASPSDFLSVAEWTLEHGLVDKFPLVMDKVVEGDKGNPAAVAYLKVKADLDRKVGDDPAASSLRGQLLRDYKTTETPHYLIVHNSANDTAVEIKTHGEHLENAFRGFYYWFALRGIALKVPQYRQVAVLTSKEEDFEQLRKILTSGPIVVDGFFARRESLPVMHAQRQDDPYKALNTFWENWKGKGYQRHEILHGRSNGMPTNGVPLNVKLAGVAGQPLIAEAQMLALMLKALEQEAELATVSHEASRQLLFASGLLPRTVAVPEWILFGMGSFFETPLQSPWPTIGAPSPYYLPRWRELKGKEPSQGGLEKTALDTMHKVVTDGYFRKLPSEGKTAGAEHILHEAALRKARTVAWSLAYFLAQKHLEGLRQYFTELSKMPRDIELDDAILLNCFARAFGCVDANNKADNAKLKALANEWYGYWQTVHFESESIMKDIRETIAKEVKEAQEQLQKQGENNGQQFRGMFPGMNPGNLPPGGRSPNAPPPGMAPPQGGRGPQQRGGGSPPNNVPPGGGRGSGRQPPQR